MKSKIKYLEGNKIFLRPLENKDINENYLLWINNTKENFYVDSTKFPTSSYALNNYYETSLKSKNSILFAICNKKGVHIGNCSISQIDWIHRKCNYGRMIGDKKNSPRGAGTQVLQLLQRYAFYHLNLNLMWTGVCKKNIKSIKSNLRAGMKNVGKLPEALFINNTYEDVLIFSITKKQYHKINS